MVPSNLDLQPTTFLKYNKCITSKAFAGFILAAFIEDLIFPEHLWCLHIENYPSPFGKILEISFCIKM